uniref:Alkylated DNA repair protein AlkB homologue 8 N-terminal domain-containing protein n=1 Tax=Nothobranchius kadleci TaxID=1051664 RepID=A0A1A8CJA4_NOTKA
MSISSLIKKEQQRLFFLQQLRKLRRSTMMMVQFYMTISDSILISSITVWEKAQILKDQNLTPQKQLLPIYYKSPEQPMIGQ